MQGHYIGASLLVAATALACARSSGDVTIESASTPSYASEEPLGRTVELDPEVDAKLAPPPMKARSRRSFSLTDGSTGAGSSPSPSSPAGPSPSSPAPSTSPAATAAASDPGAWSKNEANGQYWRQTGDNQWETRTEAGAIASWTRNDGDWQATNYGRYFTTTSSDTGEVAEHVYSARNPDQTLYQNGQWRDTSWIGSLPNSMDDSRARDFNRNTYDPRAKMWYHLEDQKVSDGTRFNTFGLAEGNSAFAPRSKFDANTGYGPILQTTKSLDGSRFSSELGYRNFTGLDPNGRANGNVGSIESFIGSIPPSQRGGGSGMAQLMNYLGGLTPD